MLKIVMSSFNIRYNFLTERDRVFIFDMAIIFYDNTLHNDLRIRKAAFPCRKNITAHSWMYASYQIANLLLLLYQSMLFLAFLFSTIVKCDLLRTVISTNNAASCELVYQSVASYGVIRPQFAEKVYFFLLFAHFALVHVIKRISNEFSFHTMYFETRVFYIPSPEARDIREKGRDLTQSYDKSPYTNRNVKRQSDKTHNEFHNTRYGMKIHLRSYIYWTLRDHDWPFKLKMSFSEFLAAGDIFQTHLMSLIWPWMWSFIYIWKK